MKRVFLILAVFALFLSRANQATASLIPSGVQNGVPYSTIVTTWGWTEIYRGGYGLTVPIATVFAGAGPNDYVIIGAQRVGSPTLEVLAAAKLSDVLTVTPTDTTHSANGSEWYFNNLSMGFAPLGESIHQISADVVNSTSFSPTYGPPHDDRLSWHSDGVNLNGGWRAGIYDFLNSEPSGWERVVFVGTAEVPEPASVTLFGLMAAGGAIYGWRRRKLAVAA